ncbi:MAG: type II secretion system protein [Phycisphaeraceae bacterium]
MTRRAFTLIELLVVIAIIALLIGILVPVLASARDAALGTSCLANHQQLMVATQNYAHEHKDRIPYGPVEPNGGVLNGGDDFYIYNGMTTSQISTKTAEPVGAGLLLDDYLSETPETLFCPGNEQGLSVSDELSRVGTGSVVSGYIYRHASTDYQRVADFRQHGRPLDDKLRIDALGDNRLGEPIAALFMDYNFLLAPGSQFYDFFHRSNHGTDFVNIAYADGHAEQRNNHDGRYSVNVVGTNLYRALDRMLEVMEDADDPD